MLKDPRLPTTDAEYEEQLTFLLRVRDRLSEADDAINQIHRELEHLPSSDLKKQFDDLLHELWEPRYTGYDDQMLVFPLKLNNRIAALQGYTDGGFAPTENQKKVYNELAADLEALLSRLKHLLEAEAAGTAK